eukprot:TRINITY_DN15471_c0_g1_i1.p1 TRINITY_DN15471_c0_g1~~TRINITY_DN15471_c0_g1_i1.p1  ORF type:complete len:536 (+),score=23.67 TRINITY_DN15471_c0_g1_i1:68-1675(+)
MIDLGATRRSPPKLVMIIEIFGIYLLLLDSFSCTRRQLNSSEVLEDDEQDHGMLRHEILELTKRQDQVSPTGKGKGQNGKGQNGGRGKGKGQGNSRPRSGSGGGSPGGSGASGGSHGTDDKYFGGLDGKWGPQELEGHWQKGWGGQLILNRLAGEGAQSEGIYLAQLKCEDGSQEQVAIKRMIVKGYVEKTDADIVKYCKEDFKGEVIQGKCRIWKDRTAKIDDLYDEIWISDQIAARKGVTTNVVLTYDFQPRNRNELLQETGRLRSLFVMMPGIPGGELLDHIKGEAQRGGWRSDTTRMNVIVARIAYDLFRGIEQLHSKGFVHCDLKPPNILVSHKDCFDSTFKAFTAAAATKKDDEKMDPIINSCKYMVADFGLSQETINIQPGDRYGTPIYMPPEVRNTKSGTAFAQLGSNVPTTGWSPKGDVFAIGLVLLDVILLKFNSFFADVIGSKTFRNPAEKFKELCWGAKAPLDEEMCFLVQSVINPFPFQRPTARMAAGLAERVFKKVWNVPRGYFLPENKIPSCLQRKQGSG